MKSTTRKISGSAMEQTFQRMIRAERGIDPALAERLARRLAMVVTSIRVRRVPLRELARPGSARAMPEAYAPPVSSHPASTPEPTPPETTPQAKAPTRATDPLSNPAAAPFDPYVFGLVPVFQREGADGLRTKLAEIASVAHLRGMAKAQQVALDPALRTGDVPAADLRAAIVAAVEKRIADRRAAAS
jgi:hypothetical protein